MPIERRYRTWFAYIDVPKDLRAKVGKRVYRHTLKTCSQATAERRGAVMVAKWKAEFARLRGNPDSDDVTFWRNELMSAKTAEDRASVLDQITAMADAIGAANVDVGQQPSSDPEARRFHAEATGAKLRVIDHLDEWASPVLRTKSNTQRRLAVERFAKKFKFIDEVNRREVKRWTVSLEEELTGSTIQRLVADIRSYWRFLGVLGAVPDDGTTPFDKLGIKKVRNRRQHYEPDEAVRLYEAASGALKDLVRVGMFTGARMEEICTLKVEHVKERRGIRFFHIVEANEDIGAKTEAGVREVPVHLELWPTIERLMADAKDGYLIPGRPDQNGDRGGNYSSYFSRLKTKLGFGPRHTFHSWRNTVVTVLERAHVPVPTIQDIVGHERTGVTTGVYSAGSTLEMRRAALELLTYPGIT